MNIQFIRSSEKRKIIEQLNEQYGITELPYLLLRSGKNKIRAFSGHLSKEEIVKIAELVRLEGLGLYLLKEEHDLRLSFDGLHLLAQSISKHVLVITPEEYELWIRGQDIPCQMPSGAYAISYTNAFIGCGRSNGQCILNHIPKERRLRK
ncbi:hypothetical protein HYZ97_01095 [Candidatus Pacearchaeota archaeon]|nr:hypothetical protein [Candidatus Pacearchaeota archaeon]